MNYSLFKWSRKTCSGHDSNAAILQASREYDWPAPPDDPQGIRVASGFEFSVCLSVCVF